MGETLYPFIETNWFNWTRSGAGGVAGIEGNDIYNLGSTGVAGKNISTIAFGIKHKPSRHMELGFAYEIPTSTVRDLFESRITVDAIFRY